MKKRFAAIALVAAFATSAANAGTVTQWTVGVNAGFDTGSVVWDSSNGAFGTQSATATQLDWGSGGPSSLTLTNQNSSSTVTTNGPAVANLSITHVNQPITGYTLDSVNLVSTLTLTPFAPSLPGLPAATLTFQINFQETPNAADPCANGGAIGVGVNSNGCADIFVIDRNALNFEFQYDTDGISGADPAETYYISFFEMTNGLNPLPTAACFAATGSNAACLGFMTPEEASTTATFAALITSQPVQIPEPGSLALLGLSLLGLGANRRYRATR
ncbi:MAG: THxN family PEP-CTERM protein [Rhodocyclaceae bacterium]|jgi:hypothetical protein|nr:THxN family PEP-CTERM protein [Rhodocyclaceae bacterium]